MSGTTLIRNGTIVDGTRLPKYVGDVLVRDGRIAKIGGRYDPAAEGVDDVIEADGLIVCPGFIDTHTHYDAQIRWDPWCTISGWHGVTSVVLGNCGFGFAPVRPEYRDRSMLTMVRTEAIPLASMQEGMIWDWETAPEYMDSLDRIPKGVNVIQFMPTASLLTYVMGLDAARSREGTEEERAEIRRLLNEAMDAGMCGFSIQRFGDDSDHVDFDGHPMVTDLMSENELWNLASVIKERGEGVIQITAYSNDYAADMAMQEKLAEVSGAPIHHNFVSAVPGRPEVHRARMKWVQDCNDRGLRIFGQGRTLRSGHQFSLDAWNGWDYLPVWKNALMGTIEERKAKIADPAVRAEMKTINENQSPRDKIRQNAIGGKFEDMIVMWGNDQPELDQYINRSLADIAQEEGKYVIDVMLDLSIATDLKAQFMGPVCNEVAEHHAEVINDSPYTWPGASDGGAHNKFFNGGAFTTDFLMWLVRDEKRVTLEEAHFRLSALPAHAAGLQNRGVLRKGAPADIVVYDLDKLAITPWWVGEKIYDLPADEWRRIQRAEGYRAIMVNGVVTFADGVCTGETPGVLVRHGERWGN